MASFAFPHCLVSKFNPKRMMQRCCLSLVLLLFLPTQAYAFQTPLDDASVVFVGHSLVNYDMPQMFRQLAEDANCTVRTADHIFNGAPLRYNWDNRFESLFSGQWPPNAFAGDALNTGTYDTLVMTEAIPLQDQITWNASSEYAGNFLDLARANNSATRVFFYETWHSRNKIFGCRRRTRTFNHQLMRPAL